MFIKFSVHLLAISFLAILPMIFYGDVLLSPMGMDLQLEPTDFLNSVFFDWDSRINLGHNTWAKGWLFPVGLFFLLTNMVGIPGAVAVKLWYILLFFLSGISMYLFMSYIAVQHHWNYRPELSSLIAAIAYMYNPFVVMHSENSHFLVPYSVLPVQLYLLSQVLKEGKFQHFFFFSITAMIVSTNFSVVIVNYVALILYSIVHILSDRSRGIGQQLKFALIAFSLMMLLSSWYWLPLTSSLLNSSQLLNTAMIQENYRMYNQSSSVMETLRLLGIWGLYSGYKGKYYKSFAPFYIDHWFIVGVTFLIPILTGLGFLFTTPLNKSLQKWRVYFGILMGLSIFMAVGAYPLDRVGLTNKFYVFLYDHIPFFSAFRNGYKFVSLLSLSYAVLIGWVVSILTAKIHSFMIPFNRLLSNSLGAVIGGIFIVSAFPLWTGTAFEKSTQISVPSYWEEAAQWINQQEDNFRLFLLPDQYFPAYYWGSGAFHKSAPWLNRDVIANSPSAVEMSEGGTGLIRRAYTRPGLGENASVHRYPFPLENGFEKIMALLNVKYIIQRDDINWNYYNVASPSEEHAFLNAQQNIRYKKTFGRVHIYEVHDYLPRIYIADPVELP